MPVNAGLRCGTALAIIEDKLLHGHREQPIRIVEEITMLTKIYALIWLAVAFAAGVFFLTGNFTMVTAVVFGFILFGLVFMGMMSVLPATVAHPAPARERNPAGTSDLQPTPVLDGLRAIKAELLSSEGVEIRKPRFH